MEGQWEAVTSQACKKIPLCKSALSLDICHQLSTELLLIDGLFDSFKRNT